MGHLLDKARRDYEALREDAMAITDKAMAENRELTDDEQTRLRQVVTAAKAAERDAKGRPIGMPIEQLNGLINAHLAAEEKQAGGGTKAAGQRGEPTIHPWAEKLKAARVAGEKAVTNTTTGAVLVGSLADTGARLGSPGGEILSLITIEDWAGRGDGSTISVVRQASRDLHAAIAPIGTKKPESNLAIEQVTADIWTFATTATGVPLAWLSDIQSLSLFVQTELEYAVRLAIEDGLLNGAGPLPGTPLGILHDPAVQTVATVTSDAPGTILAALTAVSSAGYNQGVVAMNPANWQGVSSLKDANERYLYGAGPFQSPGRAIWGAPVVLSVAVPVDTVVVGDIGAAVRFVEREPVQVIVGTQNDEVLRNERSFVVESRDSFVTVRPQALAKASLAGTGVLSVEATSTRSTSKTASK